MQNLHMINKSHIGLLDIILTLIDPRWFVWSHLDRISFDFYSTSVWNFWISAAKYITNANFSCAWCFGLLKISSDIYISFEVWGFI